MEKDFYERVELEVFLFQAADVITMSYDEDELPFIPNQNNQGSDLDEGSQP